MSLRRASCARAPSRRAANTTTTFGRRWVPLQCGAYLWPHVAGQITNAWVVGLLAIAVAAIAAYAAPQARFANTALGIWLVFSAFVTGTISGATVWNNIFVGGFMLVFSLVPNRGGSRGRRITGAMT